MASQGENALKGTIVTMDAHGNSLHADVEKETGEHLAELQLK